MEPYVLMIQTDPDDQYIVESTMREIANTISIQFIKSIEEMDRVISESGKPSVILLNDRGVLYNGTEIVKEIKSHAAYNDIPVVVLGEVSADDYVRECYRAGASTFITKPSSVAGTRKKIETFFSYWFEVAELAK